MIIFIYTFTKYIPQSIRSKSSWDQGCLLPQNIGQEESQQSWGLPHLRAKYLGQKIKRNLRCPLVQSYNTKRICHQNVLRIVYQNEEKINRGNETKLGYCDVLSTCENWPPVWDDLWKNNRKNRMSMTDIGPFIWLLIGKISELMRVSSTWRIYVTYRPIKSSILKQNPPNFL